MDKLITSALILPVFLSLLWAENSGAESQSEPSLVELARQAKKSSAGESGKGPIITNATIQKFQSASVSAGKQTRIIQTEETSEEADSDETEAESAATAKPDLEYWSSAYSEAQLNVKNSVYKGMVLRLKMNNLRNAVLREDDGASQGLIQSELQKTFAQIESNKGEVEAARTALGDLERKARLDGVLPGQIRNWKKDLPETEDFLTEMIPTP